VDRRDLQTLARIRAREAKALISAELFDGAYYLAGYAVECALKACIAKGTRRFDFPDRGRANASYTHDLTALRKLAGLDTAFRDLAERDREFGLNWGIVKAWSEESRYRTHTPELARAILKAIDDRGHGIIPWIRRYW
jgi:hypothetical protein